MDTNFKVIDAMTQNPVIISPEKSIQECAKLMSEQNVGSVVVMENGRLVGIITEFDIVQRAVAEGKNAQETTVKNMMSTSVHTIEPNVGLFDAINTMAQLDIRHLPVVNDGTFMGFLTAKDVLKIEPALFEILLDNIDLREEDRKPIPQDDVAFQADDDIE